jgi:hypothetical protein
VWRALGIREESREPTVLVDAVRSAEGDRPSLPLVLSAEACVYALTTPGGQQPFQELASHAPTDLVITTRPDDERLASVAQELVKQGQHVEFDSFWQAALGSELMAERVVSRLAALAPWRVVHVVETSASRPEASFIALSRILGCAVEPVEPQNRRWPAGKLRMLNAINGAVAAGAITVQGRHAVLHHLWDDLGKLLEREGSTGYPPVPEQVLSDLRTRWRAEWEALATHRAPEIVRHPLPDLPPVESGT